MISMHDVELFGLGTAVVVDAAAFLVVVERKNRAHASLALILLAAGALLQHLGAFVHALLLDATGTWADRSHVAAMTILSLGLLIIPGALVHTAWAKARSARRRAFLLLYMPTLALIPIVSHLRSAPRAAYLDSVETFVEPYLGWLGLATLLAIRGLRRRRANDATEQVFFRRIAICLVGLLVLHAVVLLVLLPTWPAARRPLGLLVVLSPLLLSIEFLRAVRRDNVFDLVFDRAILYATVGLAVLLFHRIFLADAGERLGARLGFDVALLEAGAVVLVVLFFAPLRRRMSEALRYLMGDAVQERRRLVRQLALDLAARSGEAPDRLAIWFERRAREALGVETVRVWTDLGTPDRDWIREEIDAANPTDLPSFIDDGDVESLRTALGNRSIVTPTAAASAKTTNLLHRLRAGGVVRLGADRPGFVFFGRPPSNREFTSEEENAAVLLSELFGIVLDSGRLQAERLVAERRALQNEKLSMLGLVAGSIAHEVKNPLSSIKTITGVVAEEEGEDGRYTEEMKVIGAEVNRLSRTITRLLDFARPTTRSDEDTGAMLEGTVRVFEHVAKRQGVTLHVALETDARIDALDRDALRDIVVNLLGNALDAAREGGDVGIVTAVVDDAFVIRVSDSGPGLDPRVHDRIFEPFATTKPDGHGLGLYVVARQVDALGGSVRCDTARDRGTCFVADIPLGPSCP